MVILKYPIFDDLFMHAKVTTSQTTNTDILVYVLCQKAKLDIR